MKVLNNRALGFVLALIMILGIMPVSAFAVEPNGGELDWGILNACAVKLEKEGNFSENDTGVSVSATLHESLEKVYMTIFAYPGNVAFDADSSVNKRLYSSYIANGQSINASFASSQLPLKKGWKIVASLNVPIGNDNYRQVLSKAIDVVDESGEAAPDYIWPDASIVETELKEGDTSAHLKLTGDERLFQNSKIDITYCVYQYPKEDKFDFENEKMIALFSEKATQAFDTKEIVFSQPLKANYRVRAVTYWTQDSDSFVPKSNDYEFGQPDDSIEIKSKPNAPFVSITSSDIKAEAKTVKVDIGGSVPSGSVLIIQSYPKGEAFKFGAGGNGVFVANKTNLTTGLGQIISVSNSGNITADKKLIAIILNSGNVVAQSSPIDIVSADTLKPFLLEFVGDAYEGDKAVALKLDYDDALTGARLLIHQDESTSTAVNLDSQIANVALSKGADGQITVPLQKALEVGKKLAASIYYCKPGTDDVYLYYTTKQIVIEPKKAEAFIGIDNKEFTKDSQSATVQISACDEFMGGQLIICQYNSSNGKFDPDSISSKRIYQKNINEQGKIICEFTQNVPLVSGNKIIAYLYKYDSATDSIKTKYSEPISVISEGEDIIPTKVQIATSTVRVGDGSIWAITNFDVKKYNGQLIVYEYEGNEFNPSSSSNIVLYGETAAPSENSRKILFKSDKLPLKSSWKLKTALILTDKSDSSKSEIIYSEPITIQNAPIMATPTVTINEKEVTEGDNKMNISVSYDNNVSSAFYTVYLYEGDTLNKDAATTKILNSGTASKWTRFPVNFAAEQRPLKPGTKIVVVLSVTTNDNKTTSYSSNIITVGARPNWATPTVAFEVPTVRANAASIPVTIRYDEGYYSLDEFYCNVTLYQYPAYVADFDHEEKYAEPVGTINGTMTKPILGENIQVPISKPLKADYKIIAKLRLPHVEWEGEEVDYLSGAAYIVDENAKETKPLVLLYQLSEDTSNGSRLRKILKDLNIGFKNIEKSQLNETIGYLAELDGYEKSDNAYSGDGYDTEFMIMSGLSEAKLDAFLHAMMAQNIRINHKAAVTETNKNWTFKQLIGDIGEEHEVFEALLELGKLTTEAENLKTSGYDAEKIRVFEQKLNEATEMLKTFEPSLENLQKAESALKKAMLDMTGRTELTGRIALECVKTGETYSVKASVADAPQNATFSYLWSNGSTETAIHGIQAEELVKLSVTATGTGSFWGTLAKTQLKVASMITKPTVTPATNKVIISWAKAEFNENTPTITEYVADVFDGETLIKTVSVSGEKTAMEFDGLTSGKDYTFKLYALNAVGHSDILTIKGKPSAANSGSSGSGGSSGSNTQSTKPTVSVTEDNKDNAVKATIKPQGKAEKGSYIVSLSAEQIASALKQAGAVQQTGKQSAKSLVIELQAQSNQSVDHLQVKIPRDIQASLAKSNASTLNIYGDNVFVGFDKETMKEIEKQAEGEVQLSVSRVSETALSNEAKDALKNRAIYDFKLTQDNKSNISDFGSGNVQLGIPYVLSQNEKPDGLFMVYIDNDGKMHAVEGSYYDAEKKMVMGITTHFSLYAVGYQEKKDTANVFTDIDNHWAKDSIEFAVSKGIFKGTGDKTFSPNTPVTRAMFITVLGRLSGTNVEQYQGVSFSDVETGSFYAPYVEWAKEAEIVSGFNGRFNPNDKISRQDMAVILSRYAEKQMKIQLISPNNDVKFADEALISDYALSAVSAMQKSGIINGKKNNMFVPKDPATRAEAAKMIAELIKTVQ